MPGVADQIRKTQLSQEQSQRKKDMSELLRMVEEGRLHEADDRQLEVIRLALDLNNLLDAKKETVQLPNPTLSVDSTVIADAFKQALQEALQNLPTGGSITNSSSVSPDRPKMKHTSLTDFSQTEDTVIVSHGDDLGETKEGELGADDKLAKLKKLKGGG